MKPGQVIEGKYRLEKEIGHGAMGSVWSGVHQALGHKVAVKFLKAYSSDKDTAAAR